MCFLLYIKDLYDFPTVNTSLVLLDPNLMTHQMMNNNNSHIPLFVFYICYYITYIDLYINNN